METRFLRSESPPEGWAKYQNNIPPTAEHAVDNSVALARRLQINRRPRRGGTGQHGQGKQGRGARGKGRGHKT